MSVIQPGSAATRVRATLSHAFRTSTARLGLRTLPDFIIIGTQRGGTTSLFKLLANHPAIGIPYRKEVHYFDNQFDQPMSWYQSYFPTTIHMRMRELQASTSITGESSPYYIFHPLAPARVAEALPNVRIIAMLRNPVDRALSHYQHSVAHGTEHLAFADALDCEAERLAGEEARLLADPLAYSFSHQHHSYVARGIYVDQLRRWSEFVPRERTLIIQSERFYRDPASVLGDVCTFLGIGDCPITIPTRHNAIEYVEMDERIRQRLADTFRPHNRRLFDDLGETWDWDV